MPVSHPLFILIDMTTTTTSNPKGQTQLALVVDDATPWRLDDETRKIGRQGLAKARAALAAAHPIHEIAA